MKKHNRHPLPATCIIHTLILVFALMAPGIHAQPDKPNDRSSRKSWRHQKAAEFRALANDELTHIPALATPMQRLGQIQTRRTALQRERQSTANETTTSRNVIIQRFHSLLQQDMKLADQSRQISHQIVENMPEIKSQLKSRRDHLNSQISADDNTTTASRDARRRVRYLDFLQRKLDDIASHPERIDLLARMLRGAPRDEPTPPQTTNTQTRLSDLRQRKEALKSQLREVDLEIRALEKSD